MSYDPLACRWFHLNSDKPSFIAVNDMLSICSRPNRVTLSVAPFFESKGKPDWSLTRQPRTLFTKSIRSLSCLAHEMERKSFFGHTLEHPPCHWPPFMRKISFCLSLTLAQSFFYRPYHETASNYVTENGDVDDGDTYKWKSRPFVEMGSAQAHRNFPWVIFCWWCKNESGGWELKLGRLFGS